MKEDILGEFGQFLFFCGIEYWETLEDKLRWALSSNSEKYLLTIEEVYDEGDEYPTLMISDVFTYQDGKLINNTMTQFNNPEECIVKYKQHTCPGCNVEYKGFDNKKDLYEFIHRNYDGDDGEYCITKQFNWS